ncbi:hypothetical protein [Pseudomonas aeruginosa]|uniref:hypothetical protein n=1 Tax=Pseudomonas aeruginosa TaxID=287 RepID=UPI000F5279DA|nr:hypothetical protein [Pseudomonas aeruginosa]MCV4188370.1 hypothetical protein [Pseudomonas aeruginosa]NTS91393.1 hypothetical protein [Pseudomonas aeruginosa]RPW02775.1 hypothetical protein IPC776_18450 [Pseudomonas aeruginosa]WCW05725.1 hypothetical protein KK222_17885 [Pseudomonas aeruginosa]
MLTLSSWITAQVPSASRSASDARAARTGTAEQAENPAAGTEAADQHVRLSQAGRELAATMGAPVEEDEDIPQELRPMVKMIRELKKKIEEKLRELREAMRSSDPGTKEARVPALQKELQQLNSALQTATAAMASAIKEMGISDPALVMKVMGSR